MNPILPSLLSLFVLLVSSAPAGKMIISNQEDFEEMIVESNAMSARTTYTPPIDAKEQARWAGKGMEVDAPDLKGRPCEQLLFMALLDACSSGGCNTGGQSIVEERVCKNLPMSDDEIRRNCCPEKLSSKNTAPPKS